jgi:uncharacterized protein YigE (DUF2233 family)
MKVSVLRIPAILRIGLLLQLFAVVSFAQPWENVKPGLAKKVFSVPTDDKTKIQAVVAKIGPSFWKLEIVDVYGTLSRQQKQYPVYSIRELIPLLGADVIINGGFSSSSAIPIPAGLLTVNNRIVARLNSRSAMQSGIFCVKRDEFKILRKEEYRVEEWTYALQAGPLVVETPGKIGIFKNEPRTRGKYRRSVVAIDKSGNLLLIASNETDLYDLAKFLTQKEGEGGLNCTVALNLGGDVDSGLLIRNEKSPFIVGSIDTTIASAIAVIRK